MQQKYYFNEKLKEIFSKRTELAKIGYEDRNTTDDAFNITEFYSCAMLLSYGCLTAVISLISELFVTNINRIRLNPF